MARNGVSWCACPTQAQDLLKILNVTPQQEIDIPQLANVLAGAGVSEHAHHIKEAAPPKKKPQLKAPPPSPKRKKK